MEFSIDRTQYEPPPGEVIDALAELSVAVIEQAEEDDLLFEMITKWSPERTAAYQQAFLMYNIASQMRDAILGSEVELPDFDI